MRMNFVAMIASQRELVPEGVAVQIRFIHVDLNGSPALELIVNTDSDTLDMLCLEPELFLHIPVSPSEHVGKMLVEKINLTKLSSDRLRVNEVETLTTLMRVISSRLDVEKKAELLNWSVVAERPFLAA